MKVLIYMEGIYEPVELSEEDGNFLDFAESLVAVVKDSSPQRGGEIHGYDAENRFHVIPLRSIQRVVMVR